MSDPLLEVTIPMVDGGIERGNLRVWCIVPEWQGINLIKDCSSEPDLDGACPIQLLEDIEYRYELIGFDTPVTIDPTELFDPDVQPGLTGRLRPGRATGSVTVIVGSGGGSAKGEFEVRSRKLEYQDEYRWMLGGIAAEATEALMKRFGASEVRLAPTVTGEPHTIYQRFALLKALLDSEELESALSLITHRPHTEYRTEIERVNPARGIRPGRQAVRALAGPGARMPSSLIAPTTVPREVDRVAHIETVDTVPNRFVKHALELWLGLVTGVREALAESNSSADRRGLREAEALEGRILSHLHRQLFADVGPLAMFPAQNQVLQRREGYRDLFRAYLMLEVAAVLDWSGGEDVFRAGQRDVATLYEYWVFLELARVVSQVIGAPLDNSSLFRVDKSGFGLHLRRQSQAVVKGDILRRGRRLNIELYFSLSTANGAATSWATTMVPDCSLLIDVSGDPGAATWLHFDAKYRLHQIKEAMVDIAGDEDPSPNAGSSTVMKVDLRKMHAYRDAIRRSAGAYVLYPGSDDRSAIRFNKYHEVLPGIGAFVLRPVGTGHAAEAGAEALAQFLDSVLDHVASQGTSRDRARYWEGQSYEDWESSKEQRLDPANFVTAPAADTLVLLGYVHSEDHLGWVIDNALYNMRGDPDRNGAIGLDSPELRATLLVLYHPGWAEAPMWKLTGTFLLRSADELRATGYPNPGGQLYCCVGLGDELTPIDAATVELLAGQAKTPFGSPVVVSWAALKFALG